MILPISNKKALRRHFLSQREGISPEEWQTRSEAIVAMLKTCPWLQTARTVLAYFSVRQEPELRSLFPLEKIWGFPVIQETDLVWYPWAAGDPVNEGLYGIPIPAVQHSAIQLQDVDLILVPAVAMDRWGYRLGYGGGFYDRLLARPEIQPIPTIGIVFEFALVPQLPQDEWDRPLWGWCTERSATW